MYLCNFLNDIYANYILCIYQTVSDTVTWSCWEWIAEGKSQMFSPYYEVWDCHQIHLLWCLLHPVDFGDADVQELITYLWVTPSLHHTLWRTPRNAPPSFQPLMELVLWGLHWSICLIYLHDIIIYSADLPQHLQPLCEVFQRFRTAGLKLKPSKCQLARFSVTFQGHRVSSDGIEPDLSNIDKVKTWAIPILATQVRAFLGLCSYYCRFIIQFANTEGSAIHLVSWSK